MTLGITWLDSTQADFTSRLDDLLFWDVGEDAKVNRTAADIIRQVRGEGDVALLRLTELFDQLHVDRVADLALGPKDFSTAFSSLPGAERDALESAAVRIRLYHEHQLQEGWTFTDADGNRLGQRVTPMDRVGLYVPGGRAAYPSTVLMTAIPAKVAGVPELVMTVPTPRGERNALVLAAAHVAGVTLAFTVGGAQAIAALAYGTGSIPKVDKIVGPGNAFVAAAKRLVFGAVGIDMIAGPSEVLIIADGTAPADWVAMDLFSQAEHDASAQAILLCPDAAYLRNVAAVMTAQLPDRPRSSIIGESLAARGALISVRDLDEAVSIANRIAPEHLQLAVAQPNKMLDGIRHAGAIFLGAHSPEVMGDYAAGPSHVLPTFGTARFSSPLGVYDFQKRSSLIELSERGAESLARTSSVLARGEGLEAHARAAELRPRGSITTAMTIDRASRSLLPQD